MNRSTPGLPVHHQLPEFTQTHIHRQWQTILTTCSHLYKPNSPAKLLRLCFSPALTRTGRHTAGTEGITPLGVGHGLEGVRVVGDQRWAVQLADAAVVEVEAGLGDRQRVGTGLFGPGVQRAIGQHWMGCPPLAA